MGWDPCWAIIKWRGGGELHERIDPPEPPYRDWIPTREPPPARPELVADTHFRYWCLLGFRGDRTDSTQTEDDGIDFRIVNSASSSLSDEAIHPKARPPMRAGRNQFATSVQPDFRVNRPTFPALYEQVELSAILQARVSESNRGSFFCRSLVVRRLCFSIIPGGAL